MTQTFTTRYGKFRSQSQSRYILVGNTASVQSPSGSGPWSVKRSAKPEVLHAHARKRGAFWNLDAGAWRETGPGWEISLIVLDKVTGQEVPR